MTSTSLRPLGTLAGAAAVLRKELREAARDRALMVQLILVPLFLYPLLGMLGYQVYLVSQGAAERQEIRVWVDAEVPEAIGRSLRERERWTVEVTPDALDFEHRGPTARGWRHARSGRAEDAPDALLAWWHAGADSAVVYYDGADDASRRARGGLREAVDDYRQRERSERTRAVGLGEADLEVWGIESVEVAESADFGAWILSLILPVVLLVMLPQGAYHATLDTIVGERERGTWETLFSSPLDRTQILVGKSAYVILWSLVSAVLNIVGIGLFLVMAARMLGLGEHVALQVDPLAAAVGVAAVVFFAVALAAIMMLVALPARSYREGQAALSPVYLVSALGALFSVTGGEALSMFEASVPVLNVAALLRSALRGLVPAGPTAVALLVTGTLAVACVWMAARVMRHETAYFDSSPRLRGLLKGALRRDD